MLHFVFFCWIPICTQFFKTHGTSFRLFEGAQTIGDFRLIEGVWLVQGGQNIATPWSSPWPQIPLSSVHNYHPLLVTETPTLSQQIPASPRDIVPLNCLSIRTVSYYNIFDKHNFFRFREQIGFSGVLGVLDGTLIAIQKPEEGEAAFMSRKRFHALNCQMVSVFCPRVSGTSWWFFVKNFSTYIYMYFGPLKRIPVVLK